MADPRLLVVVEGRDDERVLSAITRRQSFQPQFEIKMEEGYENLRKRLSPRLKPGTDVERLGIVVDVGTRWKSIKGILDRAGYVGVPDRPDPAGTIVGHDVLPRLGVWIMPNNELPGMLEDYLAFLVPPGDLMLKRARESLDGIPLEERRFAEVHRSKALIHTYLAWQKDPGIPLGQAVMARYFETEGPQVVAFLAWLTRLFS
jgi:hypothetical protein